MLEYVESVCPGCGEQAAGQQFCPACGLLIGSFLAADTSAPEPAAVQAPALAPVGLAAPAHESEPESESEPAHEPEPESAPEPEPEPGDASPEVSYASPSSPWAASFTAHVPDEADDDAPAPIAASLFTTEDATPAEPETVESSPEPASLPDPVSAPAPALAAGEADDEPAGETAEAPAPEVAPAQAPAPMVPPVSVHGSNAISPHRSSDRRAALACVAALLFAIVVLMNRGLRR